MQATGFVEHLKLPHYVDFQAELALLRDCALNFRREGERHSVRRCRRPPNDRPAYNFAYLDEQTKRMIRRAILKAIAIPGYQVPFASREMPMPYGWGTGGVQVTAAIIGPDDVLKVIDQGADDTTNAVSIRNFFAKTAGVATTTETTEATIIQTRHRIPETPLTGKIRFSSTRCRSPSRCAFSSRARPRRAPCTRSPNTALCTSSSTRTLRATAISRRPTPIRRRSRGATSWIRRRSRSSTIPRLNDCPALQLFGAGREKRIYAIPPHTRVVSLDFEDHPFERTAVRRDVRILRRDRLLSRRGHDRRPRQQNVRLLRHRLLREPPRGCGHRRKRRRRDRRQRPAAALRRGLSKRFGASSAAATCRFELYEGEVLAIVGESGSGKTTLLHLLSARLEAQRRANPLPHARRRPCRSLGH